MATEEAPADLELEDGKRSSGQGQQAHEDRVAVEVPPDDRPKRNDTLPDHRREARRVVLRQIERERPERAPFLHLAAVGDRPQHVADLGDDEHHRAGDAEPKRRVEEAERESRPRGGPLRP